MTDIPDFLIGMLIIFLLSIMGYGVFNVAHATTVQNKRHEACLIAGGIPIETHCVKPGSFIEVKP